MARSPSSWGGLSWKALLALIVMAAVIYTVNLFRTINASFPLYPASVTINKLTTTSSTPSPPPPPRVPAIRPVATAPRHADGDTQFYLTQHLFTHKQLVNYSSSSSIPRYLPSAVSSPSLFPSWSGPSDLHCCHEDPPCYNPILDYGQKFLEVENKLMAEQPKTYEHLRYYFHEDSQSQSPSLSALDGAGACGSGVVDVNDERDAPYYYNAAHCFNLARAIPNDNRYCVNSSLSRRLRDFAGAVDEPVTFFHVYWSGQKVHPHVAYAMKAILGSQDLSQTRLIVWGESDSLAALRSSPVIQLASMFPFDPQFASSGRTVEDLEAVEFRELNFQREIQATGVPSLIKALSSIAGFTDGLHWADSDLFRLLILFNYGGVYIDLDVLVLRDMAPINGNEWFYKWGCDCDHINGALSRLFPKSTLGRLLLEELARKPMVQDSTQWGRETYLAVYRAMKSMKHPNIFTIYPTCFFNPPWLSPDKKFSNDAGQQYPSQWVGPFAYHLHGQIWKVDVNGQTQSDYRAMMNKIDEQMKKRIKSGIIKMEKK